MEKASYPGIDNVSSTYGAPMGRRNFVDPDEDQKIYLRRLEFIDACYDKGGAYWGMPANLYHACTSNKSTEIFVRASSRADAKRQIRELVPTARFFR